MNIDQAMEKARVLAPENSLIDVVEELQMGRNGKTDRAFCITILADDARYFGAGANFEEALEEVEREIKNENW